MLQKPDHDAIDKVRNDPDVREAIDFYHHFLNLDDDQKKLMKFTATLRFGKAFFGKRFDPDKYALSVVIKKIAKAYKSVTGKSAGTTNGITGEYPFDPFVKQLFVRESLDPPGIYKIKQAIKKKK